MLKTDYGEVYTVAHRNGIKDKFLVKCFYKNASLGVIGEYLKDDENGQPLFGKLYRIVILGDLNNKYSGLTLDYIYPKTQKAARQLADELDTPNWNNWDRLSDEEKNELRQKIKKAAEK